MGETRAGGRLAESIAATLTSMASLHAIAGPLQGAIFRLPPEEVSIGRLSFNQLCVSDPSVSRQHCLIAATDPVL
jgi:hypothetical protein